MSDLRHHVLAVSMALLIATLPAVVLAGTASDPEVRDACGDTLLSVLGVDAGDQVDIDSAWMVPDQDELVIQICGDLGRGEISPFFAGHEEAAAARYGWQFRFNDTEGNQYNVRAWSTFGNWFQCVTRNGEIFGKQERHHGRTPYPIIDHEKDRLTLHFPPAGDVPDVPTREDLHAVGVVHNETRPLQFQFAVDCGSHYQVIDRAPDEGYGRDVDGS